MHKLVAIFIICFIPVISNNAAAQDSLSFKGQASAWVNFNPTNDLPVFPGIRYIPQLNYKMPLKNGSQIDFEASVNLFGTAGFHPFDTIHSAAILKSYRLWARYSSQQFEIRIGLQKINFGSALLLRPLMWFDKVDPRDPLRLTDGVWGVLGRYYFLNNANIWLWGLYGNQNPRGWDLAESNKKFPEFGGRIQLPVPAGEVALSYHHRVADTRKLGEIMPQYSEVSENRIGFDIKLDLIVGLWFEGTLVTKNLNLVMFTNQKILNAGSDYTFGIGNGLYAVFEQLLAFSTEKALDFHDPASFSLLSLSYPVGLSDNISGIVYYDWKNKNSYNFFNWQRQFNNISLYLMAYWNPDNYIIPTQDSGQNIFAGKGIQIMFVLNH